MIPAISHIPFADRKAHRGRGAARPFPSDAGRVAHLFKLYSEMTKEEK